VLNRQGQVIAVVRNTHSIYQTESRREQKNVQMVCKTCIPSKNLLSLIQPIGEDAANSQPEPGTGAPCP
jgi:hypothetical protein